MNSIIEAQEEFKRCTPAFGTLNKWVDRSLYVTPYLNKESCKCGNIVVFYTIRTYEIQKSLNEVCSSCGTKPNRVNYIKLERLDHGYKRTS